MPIPYVKKPHARIKAVDTDRHTDWLGLWALSMGVAAIGLAAIAYLTIGDTNGAAFILFAAAALIGMVFGFSSREPT